MRFFTLALYPWVQAGTSAYHEELEYIYVKSMRRHISNIWYTNVGRYLSNSIGIKSGEIHSKYVLHSIASYYLALLSKNKGIFSRQEKKLLFQIKI